MPKFRKIPTVIDAVQFDGNQPYPEGVCTNRCPPTLSTLPHVHTAHKNQLVILEPGDWIIPESDGIHFYPCKPHVFANTYEPL